MNKDYINQTIPITCSSVYSNYEHIKGWILEVSNYEQIFTKVDHNKSYDLT